MRCWLLKEVKSGRWKDREERKGKKEEEEGGGKEAKRQRKEEGRGIRALNKSDLVSAARCGFSV